MRHLEVGGGCRRLVSAGRSVARNTSRQRSWSPTMPASLQAPPVVCLDMNYDTRNFRSAAPRSRTSGLTLIELLVTLAVVVILLTLAVPNLSGLIDRRALSSAHSALYFGLQTARSEAIKREEPFTATLHMDGSACPVTGYEPCPWLLVHPGDTVPDNTNTVLLRQGLSSRIRLVDAENQTTPIQTAEIVFGAIGERLECRINGNDTSRCEFETQFTTGERGITDYCLQVTHFNVRRTDCP